jgi:hypothetical protein
MAADAAATAIIRFSVIVLPQPTARVGWNCEAYSTFDDIAEWTRVCVWLTICLQSEQFPEPPPREPVDTYRWLGAIDTR